MGFRTTIALEDEEHAALKRIAKRKERSVTAEIRYAVRERIRTESEEDAQPEQEGGAE